MNKQKLETELHFNIKDISPFKICLESVKYPDHSDKNQFRDVLFQAEERGVVLKWTDYKGVVSTKAMIRKDYFHNQEFRIDKKSGKGVEFCIPPNILLGIIEKVNSEDTVLEFNYPVRDACLQMIMHEEFLSEQNNVRNSTSIDFETYTPSEGLKNDFSITTDNWVGNVYARISTFKKALKELQFLEENTPITLKFSMEYPHFQIVYNEGNQDDNYFVIKFSSDPGDIRYTIKSNISSNYTIGSLRLAFSRFSKDNLNCALLISNDGYLSIKIVQENKNVFIESIVANLDDGNDIDMS